jgi:probable rRNA maturation factor
MKLNLVDRRPDPGTLPLSSERLAGLVDGLGREDWTLNLVLVSDQEMAALNRRWYGGEGVTDVLSFGYLEESGPDQESGPDDAPHLAAGTGGAACDLWVPPGEDLAGMTAGEVVVAPDFVARRARSEAADLSTEWALLLVHGTLHILGWRHDETPARRAMRAQEAAVLAGAGFTHPMPLSAEED